MPIVNEEIYKKIQLYRERNIKFSGTFAGTEDFCAAWYMFVESIGSTDYENTPTFSDFARWLNIPFSTVYRFIAANPKVKDELIESIADCLSEGALKKKYESRMAGLVLKNRCMWTEKSENRNYSGEKPIATDEEAEKKIRQALKAIEGNGERS